LVANSGRVAFGVPVKGKSLRPSPQGRVCQTDGCSTVLSIYNDSLECSLHEIRSPKGRRDP